MPGRVQIGVRRQREYRGRLVYADTDLHERLAAALATFVQPPARVADIGCGAGAFSARLADLGYSVLGADLDERDDPSYERLDLFSAAERGRFLDAHRRSFDAVTLVEVIEHVHDPWQTLSFCHELLRPEGVLLLSTPNITSFYSRFLFLFGGRFHQFGQEDLSYGHLNPMTPLMIETALTETGFEPLHRQPGQPMPILVWDTSISSLAHRIFHAMSFLLAACLAPVMRGGNRDGWSLIFVARTSANE